MPIYEFRCNNKLCVSYNKIIEVVKNIKDETPEKCLCGRTLEKDISLSSFILKGSGWYRDGYNKGSR